MPLYDFPLHQLQAYQPERTEAPDFDVFWQRSLDQVRQFPLNATFEPVQVGLATIEAFDVTFSGYGGQPIKAWLMLPRYREGKLPCVVEYIGYGGGRGYPLDWLIWSSAGYAHLIMDTRGQGSAWRSGDTPDLASEGDNPQYPGFVTRGVLDPETFYYRRLYLDAVRAVEAARSHPEIDADRVVVQGESQGGGVTLAVAALLPDVAAAMPDVPFLCHFQRAAEITNKVPYLEITTYCKVHRDKVRQVFKTLSYFDGMNLAARAQSPALFSVALMDETSPPSTVYAAYNNYAGAKDIRVYPFNGHEGGQTDHRREQIAFLKGLWG